MAPNNPCQAAHERLQRIDDSMSNWIEYNLEQLGDLVDSQDSPLIPKVAARMHALMDLRDRILRGE